MTLSNRLGITELEETQNNRSVTINEAIAKLEAGATFFAAIQVLLNTPPVSPVEGDLYVVGTAGTGAWSGFNENVALYYNAAWLFFTPFEGMFAWDQTSNTLKRHDGSDWVAYTVGGGSVSDGDYGEISVSGGVWTIDAGVVVRPAVTANFTAGYTSTAFNAGTKSSGTYTPAPADGNLQRAVNGGAHTLAPPSVGSGDATQITVQYTNNGSAGAITTSGFTKITGDSLTTANGDDFMLYLTVINGFSVLNVVALQ